MSEIGLTTLQFEAEKYVENLYKIKHLQDKLYEFPQEDKFRINAYFQGYLLAYHSAWQESLAKKGIILDDLDA